MVGIEDVNLQFVLSNTSKRGDLFLLLLCNAKFLILVVLQLVHHIPETGINHQRVPQSSTASREPDQSSSDHEQTARQRARSRDEV